MSVMQGSRRLVAGLALCLVASCSTLLELDEDYFVASTTATGGAGGTGADCPDGEQDNDENGSCEPACTSDTCSGHGTCDDSSGTATCECDPNWDGDACDTCAEGYTGSDCTECATGYQDNDGDDECLPECTNPPCSGHGDCDDSSGVAICTCRPDFSGTDCGTACGDGTAGPDCAFRIIYGLDIPVAVGDWDLPADVPYDTDDADSAATFDRVAYRLILDDEEVWAELDPFTGDATELGLPFGVIHDVAVTNVTVLSFAANQPTIASPADGNVESWSNCYSAGPNGVYDHDDDISSGTECYGCVQVHVDSQVVLAFNRWSSSSGDHELGIGPSPTGNPDYTFEQNAGDYASRRLEVYVREP